MNKTNLSKHIASRMSIPEIQARHFIDTLFEVITDTLHEGEDIRINDFGSLLLWTQRERPGRNPRTGEPAMIPARKSVKFKPGKGLLKALNKT